MVSLSMIVGLGNPGVQYSDTRHNIGFLVVECLARRLGIRFKVESWLNSALGKGNLGSQEIMLLLPMTYMNISGTAIRKALSYFHIPFPHPRSLLVVTDDVYLPFGKMRVRAQGSAGGHNGLESINQQLSREFWRLRVGVGPFPVEGEEQIPLKDFVLSSFPVKEKEGLETIIEAAASVCECWLTKGGEAASHLAADFSKKRCGLEPLPSRDREPKSSDNSEEP